MQWETYLQLEPCKPAPAQGRDDSVPSIAVDPITPLRYVPG